MTIFNDLFSTANLVHLALIFYCAGLMVRDELLLRVLILIGTIFYLSYYYFFPVSPLWDAMFASAAIATVNLVLIATVVHERTTLAMSSEEAALYERFNVFSPGQFRKLMRKAEWRSAQNEVELTREGEQPPELHFIISGDVHLKKFESHHLLGSGKFIGEIAFLDRGIASATTLAVTGTRYVSWNVDHLRSLFRRHPSLEHALVVLLSRDLSKKVAASNPKI